ncbi:nitroreductase family protein [Paucibacter soli]|uniref:nitroreductase family protein n=1 Tax=Paucibacter soli TaxID=3133433 RepID=UPI0030A1A813
MKFLLHRLLPRSAYLILRRRWRVLRNGWGLLRALGYDGLRYWRGSGLVRRSRGALQAHILKSYHRVEKGLALPQPRPGFGSDAIELLCDDLGAWLERYPSDWSTHAALDTLDAYLAFNRDHGHAMQTLAGRVQRLRALAGQGPEQGAEGGLLARRREEVWAAARLPFDAFLRSRHSVRQFDARPLEADLIEQAVAMARFAPSVCNRSSGRVYWVSDAARAQALLAHQNGNRGFGDQAGALLIVTARQSTFHTVGERYQAWIDGGLFGMTLVYALHALGLGTCCLNWSVEPATDRAFKREAGIPADDAVIMLLAVGHLREQFEVARSERRPLDEVLVRL